MTVYYKFHRKLLVHVKTHILELESGKFLSYSWNSQNLLFTSHSWYFPKGQEFSHLNKNLYKPYGQYKYAENVLNDVITWLEIDFPHEPKVTWFYFSTDLHKMQSFHIIFADSRRKKLNWKMVWKCQKSVSITISF